MENNFSRDWGPGDGLGIIQVCYTDCALHFYYYYISSTSDHQTLGWGLLSRGLWLWYLTYLRYPVELCSSCVQLFAATWSAGHQALLFMGFPGKNIGVGCHFLLQGIFHYSRGSFPLPGINPSLVSPDLGVGSLPLVSPTEMYPNILVPGKY